MSPRCSQPGSRWPCAAAGTASPAARRPAGVVIDVGPMDGVAVDGDVATIGAGARLGRVYDALEPARAHDGGGVRAGRRDRRADARRRPGAPRPPPRPDLRSAAGRAGRARGRPDRRVRRGSVSRTCSGRCAARAAGSSASSRAWSSATLPEPSATSFHARFAARRGRGGRRRLAALGARRAGRAGGQPPGDRLRGPGRADRRHGVRRAARRSGGAGGAARRPRRRTGRGDRRRARLPRDEAAPRRGRRAQRRAAAARLSEVRVLPGAAAARTDRGARSPTWRPTGVPARRASSTSRRGAARTTASRPPRPRSRTAPSASCSSRT